MTPNLTPTQQKKVAQFLSVQLETLREENRIGRCHYNDELTDRDMKMLENAIIMMSEEIWK